MPERERKKAFLSYAHRYQPWVKILHRNLEASLGEEVFLDEVDLASGRSWIGQLQAGLDQAEQFILVVTPEASPRCGSPTNGKASSPPGGTGERGTSTSFSWSRRRCRRS
jgi:hypothetical protein